MNGMRATRFAVGVVAPLVMVGLLAACGEQGVAVPAATTQPTTTTAPTTTTTTAAPSTKTVYLQPPTTKTVYVPPPVYTPAQAQWYAQPSWVDSQPWITIVPAPGQTPCQWLHATGYTYAQAFAAWAQNRYPANWSATGDGYPCQRSYGMQH
jgi:hypothetical protein